MNQCKHCMKVGGILLLVFGVLFLLRDFGVWDFWNIQWWTVLFILLGAMHLGSSNCPKCQGQDKKGR